MRTIFGWLSAALPAVILTSAPAQSKVSIAVGGRVLLCYLPTICAIASATADPAKTFTFVDPARTADTGAN